MCSLPRVRPLPPFRPQCVPFRGCGPSPWATATAMAVATATAVATAAAAAVAAVAVAVATATAVAVAAGAAAAAVTAAAAAAVLGSDRQRSQPWLCGEPPLPAASVVVSIGSGPPLASRSHGMSVLPPQADRLRRPPWAEPSTPDLRRSRQRARQTDSQTPPEDLQLRVLRDGRGRRASQLRARHAEQCAR